MKMRFIRQAPDGCLGAAIAMVTENMASLKEYNRRMKLRADNDVEFLTMMMDWIDKYSPWVRPVLVMTLTNSNVPPLPGASSKGDQTSDLRGRGIILLAKGRPPRLRHAVAYEDGFVLDPSWKGTPETLTAMLTRRTGSHVEAVIPYPTKEADVTS